jgi:tetratricopeptide (TPR) repeat protein
LRLAAASAARAKRDFRSAEAHLRAGLSELDEHGIADHRLAETLRDLVGTMLRGYQSPELMEPHARRLLELQESINGANSPQYIAALHLLAETLVKLRQGAEAEALLRRALAIREHLHGLNAPELIGDLHALGVRLWGNRKFAESEAAFRRALTILRTTPPDFETIGQAAILDCLAMLYDRWPKPHAAEEIIRELLRLADDRDDDELTRADSLERLAAAYRAQAKLEQSELTYRLAIQNRQRGLRRTIRAKRFGKPETAGTRVSLQASMSGARLAYFHKAAGSPAAAAPLYARAIALYRHAAASYTAPSTHADQSHRAIREMFSRWADDLERAAEENAAHLEGERPL